VSAREPETLPLLAHDSLEAPLAYRNGTPITVQRFLADVARLSERLPDARHLLNTCIDRYRFTVGLAACMLSERVSLLPSTHTPEVIRRLRAFSPDLACLTDTDQEATAIDLPVTNVTAVLARSVDSIGNGAVPSAAIPRLAPEQLIAIVFTSGSTGEPTPFGKTWGRLSACVRAGASRLGLTSGRWTLVGTVPPQHMFGFESTVLLALLTGAAFTAERPFYPADVGAALEAAVRPRALITTPIHLRTLLASDLPFPRVDLIVSATAPLSRSLAREAEQRFGARLLEIYGSTETGQIATRRTLQTDAWRLWPGVRLRIDGGDAHAEGGHLEQPTRLCDVIEPLDEEHFALRGRTADLVNVAGKRSSLAYLNAQLQAIPGVLDGAFFWPDAIETGVTRVPRLAAAVVAPGLSTAQLLELLRERIDPVFLPRPLVRVERLPRNATGKLPQHALRALARKAPADTGTG
jgi:acyl-coenzyme A synthetase/AMP-(fatty) acid ligase